MSAKRPCRTCPWRVTQDASEIPNFNLELAEDLVDSSGSPGDDRPIGSPMFACHQSKPQEEIVCMGWLKAVGAYHLGVRVQCMDGGSFDPEDVFAPPDDSWPELESSFEAVIRKLRRTA